jgi:hypothetical protein
MNAQRALTLRKLVDLTLNELEKYDGKDGKPAYFARAARHHELIFNLYSSEKEQLTPHPLK